MAIMNFYDKVAEAIDKSEFCLGIFIDLSKAFYTLNHDFLLINLKIYGIKAIPNTLMQSYLQDGQQYVVYSNS